MWEGDADVPRLRRSDRNVVHHGSGAGRVTGNAPNLNRIRRPIGSRDLIGSRRLIRRSRLLLRLLGRLIRRSRLLIGRCRLSLCSGLIRRSCLFIGRCGCAVGLLGGLWLDS